MGDILIDASQLFWQQGIRPKAGAKPGLDGKIADADQEVYVAACIGCIKAGPSLLDRTGKQRGALVPIAIFAAPYEVVADAARKQLTLGAAITDAKEQGEP